MIVGSTHHFGQRTLIIAECSPVESPTPIVDQDHRHLWIRCVRRDNPKNTSVVGPTAILRFIHLIFGADANIPYCKPVKNLIAWRTYCNKLSGSSLSGYDSVVISALQSNPGLSDTDVLAGLIPTLGVSKCQEYRSKLPILRDYVKLQNKIELPSSTTADEFVLAIVDALSTATITIPGYTLSQPLAIQFVLFHLICMHNLARATSPNGDGLFALFLCGPPQSGKTTFATGLVVHMPPPAKGVGKWATSAPVLLFDDWDPTKLFDTYSENIRRAALGHDLTVSVTGSSRSIGSKWVIVTSNEDLTGQHPAVLRRFITIDMPKLTTPRQFAPPTKGML